MAGIEFTETHGVNGPRRSGMSDGRRWAAALEAHDFGILEMYPDLPDGCRLPAAAACALAWGCFRYFGPRPRETARMTSLRASGHAMLRAWMQRQFRVVCSPGSAPTMGRCNRYGLPHRQKRRNDRSQTHSATTPRAS